jgi:7-cyano-7-deazaguanine synthase in queuosine biosynthesis
VRNVELWQRDDLTQALQETLKYLSGEPYHFEFEKAVSPVRQESMYFEFTDDPLRPEDVCLFSGGIDSFAGAVEQIVGNDRKLAMVGHHSSDKTKHVQEDLVESLKNRGYGNKIHYIPITVRNTNYSTPKEYTQRSRSFLFACLAMAIADMYGKEEFTFFENGVVSLNIPISADVLESRATRTTHPQVINGLKEIFSLVFGREIDVRHPYQWLTKREVTEKISEHSCSDLLEVTNSCTRPRGPKKGKTHCGICSQCIDRRFGILAAGMGDDEPEDNYNIPLLTGRRTGTKEINLALQYVKFARDFSQLRGPAELLNNHPSMSDALHEYEDLTSEQAEERIFDLYKRHAEDVLGVLERGFNANRLEWRAKSLPNTSLLELYFNRAEILNDPDPALNDQMKNFMDGLNKPICEFAVDEDAKIILFRDGSSLSGKNYDLVKTLFPNFERGKSQAADVDYFSPPDLADELQVTEQSLRQQVGRLKKEIEQSVPANLGIVFGDDGFIENKHGAGYRLSPLLKKVHKADLNIP